MLGAVIAVIYVLTMVMMWLQKVQQSKKLTEQLQNLQNNLAKKILINKRNRRQAGDYPAWRLKYLSATYRIRFDFIINRLYFFLHSKVLTEPDEEIDKEENSDIACYTPKAMRHPVHTISDRQH